MPGIQEQARKTFALGLEVGYNQADGEVGTIGFHTTQGNSPTKRTLGVTASGVELDGALVLDGSVDAVQSTGLQELDNAACLALNSSPQEVIPAPGAGFYVRIVAIHVKHKGDGETAFASGGAMGLRYTDGSGALLTPQLAVAGFWNQTTDETRFAPGVADFIEPVENAAVVLAMDTGDLTTGTGSLEYIVEYAICAMA